MPLYEVAIIEHPTKKDKEEGKAERLVMAPKAVVARDPQSAALVAAMGESGLSFDSSRSEVFVRPFAE